MIKWTNVRLDYCFGSCGLIIQEKSINHFLKSYKDIVKIFLQRILGSSNIIYVQIFVLKA